MIDCKQTSSRLQSLLNLSEPPIGIAFLERRPDHIASFSGAVPSACSFWRKAESDMFFADAQDHANCPIGALTMGFDPPETLGAFLQKMCGCGYVAEEEAAKIPSISKPKTGILYGPLAKFDVQPDLVLFWVSPQQAMILSEALGNMSWTQQVPATAFGRPACAALPVAQEQDQPTLSLGCMGMRTFTEIPDNRLMGNIPVGKVNEVLSHLEKTISANQEMQQFYEGHKAQFAS